MTSNGEPGFGGQPFDQLARQYWNAWGEAMRAGAAPSPSPSLGWNEAIGWWSQLAKSVGGGGAGPQAADDAIGRFNSQAQHWFAQMQQLAAQFAGTNASPAEIGAAWQRMLGGDSAKVLVDLFKNMHGPGQFGVEQWMEQMAPVLQGMQREGRSWLGLPAFGFSREHQERWQALAQAQLDFQEKYNAYNALMADANQRAFRAFEAKLAEHSAPGQALPSARALFDLWIDAAEDAYAELALSPRFGEAYGDMVNAQMRVRAGLQREVEQSCAQLGIPTRSEMDAAHRKIVQLERELRRLRDAMRMGEGTPTAEPAERRSTGRAGKRAGKSAGSADVPKSPKSTAGKPRGEPRR